MRCAHARVTATTLVVGTGRCSCRSPRTVNATKYISLSFVRGSGLKLSVYADWCQFSAASKYRRSVSCVYSDVGGHSYWLEEFYAEIQDDCHV